VRVDAVHRLRRAKEFEAVVQKEEFEVKNLKSDTLLETKQRLVDQQRNSAIDFSVHSQVRRFRLKMRRIVANCGEFRPVVD